MTITLNFNKLRDGAPSHPSLKPIKEDAMKKNILTILKEDLANYGINRDSKLEKIDDALYSLMNSYSRKTTEALLKHKLKTAKLYARLYAKAWDLLNGLTGYYLYQDEKELTELKKIINDIEPNDELPF